jgi:cytochrome c2
MWWLALNARESGEPAAGEGCRAGQETEGEAMKIKMSAAAVALVLSVPFAAHAEGDAAKGEKVWVKCKICHQVGPTAKNLVGPIQNNLIGRTAGTVEGFKGYSTAMKEAGQKGLVWTEENIDKYLADPKGFVPKNKMAFVGLPKAEDRADVIAYLKQFSKK